MTAALLEDAPPPEGWSLDTYRNNACHALVWNEDPRECDADWSVRIWLQRGARIAHDCEDHDGNARQCEQCDLCGECGEWCQCERYAVAVDYHGRHCATFPHPDPVVAARLRADHDAYAAAIEDACPWWNGGDPSAQLLTDDPREAMAAAVAAVAAIARTWRQRG